MFKIRSCSSWFPSSFARACASAMAFNASSPLLLSARHRACATKKFARHSWPPLKYFPERHPATVSIDLVRCRRRPFRWSCREMR